MDKIYILYDVRPHEPDTVKVCSTIAGIEKHLQDEGHMIADWDDFIVEEWELDGDHLSDMWSDHGFWQREQPGERGG